jgi:hypothetical protein
VYIGVSLDPKGLALTLSDLSGISVSTMLTVLS